MKKIALFPAFIFISFISFSQTKRIAHRSHSGRDNSFIISATTDNFGLPVPAKNKKNPVNPKKDSLKTKPVKDSLKTTFPVPEEKKDTLQHELAIVFLTAMKLFDL